MSAPRIVMSVAAFALGVSAASWYATSVFPILSASRVELPEIMVAPIDDGWLIAEPQLITVVAVGSRQTGAQPRDAVNEVTPENPIPRRNRGASPAYPRVAGAQPEVVVNTLVSIGRDGAVEAFARALAGVDATITASSGRDELALVAAQDRWLAVEPLTLERFSG